jgi:hypothetical protein
MYKNQNKSHNEIEDNYYYQQEETNDQNFMINDRNIESNQHEELPLSTKIQEKKTEVKVKISMLKRNVIEFKREIDKS